MGYSTEFKGVLTFTRELTASELAKVKVFLGEDCRKHSEWTKDRDLSYIDLELADDFSGLKWNGAEKTYFLDKLVQVVIDNMRREVPDFDLQGSLSAQGEQYDDRWTLTVKDGVVTKTEIPITGHVIECPRNTLMDNESTPRGASALIQALLCEEMALNSDVTIRVQDVGCSYEKFTAVLSAIRRGYELDDAPR